MKDYIRLHRQHMPNGDGFARTMLINEHLEEILKEEPLDLTIDLNPHLQVIWAIDETIKRVTTDGEGITCDRNDVYQFWLVRELGSNRIDGIGKGDALLWKLNKIHDDVLAMPLLETEEEIDAASREELVTSMRNALKKLVYLDEIAGMLKDHD